MLFLNEETKSKKDGPELEGMKVEKVDGKKYFVVQVDGEERRYLPTEESGKSSEDILGVAKGISKHSTEAAMDFIEKQCDEVDKEDDEADKEDDEADKEDDEDGKASESFLFLGEASQPDRHKLTRAWRNAKNREEDHGILDQDLENLEQDIAEANTPAQCRRVQARIKRLIATAEEGKKDAENTFTSGYGARGSVMLSSSTKKYSKDPGRHKRANKHQEKLRDLLAKARIKEQHLKDAKKNKTVGESALFLSEKAMPDFIKKKIAEREGKKGKDGDEDDPADSGELGGEGKDKDDEKPSKEDSFKAHQFKKGEKK
jgi:hypothetical protein